MNNIEQQLHNSTRAPATFTASNGLVLRIRPVSSHVIRDLMRTLPEPKVPIVHLEAKERDEPNPLDPDYIEAVAEYKLKVNDLTERAYLLHTDVYSQLPEGLESYEGTDWSDFQRLVGLEIHTLGRERYVDWLKYHALTDKDFNDLMTAILVAGGMVSEEAVQQAIESFPNNSVGTTDTSTPTG